MAHKRHRGRAWIKQLARQVRDVGGKLAPWYTIWDEPDGTRRMKSAGPGSKGKGDAAALRDKINSQITLGEYESDKGTLTTWKEFVAEYVAKGMRNPRPLSVQATRSALNRFAKVLKLDNKPVASITTKAVDDFIASRMQERGLKPGSTMSAATVNKDLRHIKAALRCAKRWKLLPEVPDIRFADEDRKLHRYITNDHFALIFEQAKVATQPENLHYPAAEWWRALLAFAFLTGWRISEMLAVEWRDIDLEGGYAMTRAESNKGRRDSIVALSPEVVSRLRPLKSFDPRVFPWDHDRKMLDKQFHAIQTAAGIELECVIPRQHECTDSCKRYGFHDGRRAFATMNATRMSAEQLQALMRHSSYQTTQRYIQLAKELRPVMQDVFVPPILQIGGSGGNGVVSAGVG